MSISIQSTISYAYLCFVTWFRKFWGRGGTGSPQTITGGFKNMFKKCLRYSLVVFLLQHHFISILSRFSTQRCSHWCSIQGTNPWSDSHRQGLRRWVDTEIFLKGLRFKVYCEWEERDNSKCHFSSIWGRKGETREAISTECWSHRWHVWRFNTSFRELAILISITYIICMMINYWIFFWRNYTHTN